MRVWDLSPGYLNRQSLLGEHREVHGILSILVHHKKGYARHPETLRWKLHRGALRRRHDALALEMELRGYRHLSPALPKGEPGRWPEAFIDPPGRQFELLAGKYLRKEPGRIPLPGSLRELREQHRYSVLARGAEAQRDLGSLELALLLRRPPTLRGLTRALQRMWEEAYGEGGPPKLSPGRMLRELVLRSPACPPLGQSTALGELGLYV